MLLREWTWAFLLVGAIFGVAMVQAMVWFAQM